MGSASDLKTIDLRRISRNPRKCLTTVELQLDWDTKIPWLRFGEASLDYSDRTNIWTLGARIGFGATDFEHDSAHLLSLPLIGLKLEMVIGHMSFMSAYIHGDAEHFLVPPDSNYNPMKLPGASVCKEKRCGKPHPVVPQGYYVPPANPELHRRVMGKRVEIRMGPFWPKGK